MLYLNFEPFPKLETPRLQLTRITTDDAAAVFVLRTDDNVMQFLDRPKARSLDDALKLIDIYDDTIDKNDGIIWKIAYKDDPGLIGTIGFWSMLKEHYRAEIGYMLNSSEQGKGVMSEALQAVLDYGFKQMNLHSVEANVNPHNHASIKLLERNDFKREGYFRQNYYYNGRFFDSAIYSLITPLKA
jgi:ribosomal-protein-alanine N-acetyltransferase